jgi:outer membrane cobalamin receptor
VDVRRRGTEAGLELQPAPALRLGGTIGWSAVTYRSTGAQVPYRPRTTAAAHVGWTTGPWTVDARVQHLGSRPRDAANRLPPISLIHLSLERRFGTALRGTLDVRDLADRRAEFIAGHPGPGRTVVLTLDLEAP